jgi:hypothetical protein
MDEHEVHTKSYDNQVMNKQTWVKLMQKLALIYNVKGSPSP